MRRGLLDGFGEPIGAFEMTPILDVVFLLIIFFLLVFQFFAAEKMEVQVPDSIHSAQAADEEVSATVTVGRDREGRIFFRVEDTVVEETEMRKVPAVIAGLIDRHPLRTQEGKKIVRLRCDKEVPFGAAKYALQGIVRSTATDIQWSVIKER